MSDENKRLSLGKKLVFAIVTIIVFFVLLEVILRFILPIRYTKPATNSFSEFFTIPGKKSEGEEKPKYCLFKPNLKFWCDSQDGIRRTYQVNSMGLQGDVLDREKPAGAFYIAALGDSITMGMGLKDGEKTYCDILREKLKSAYPARQTKISDAGVLGFTIEQGFNLFINEFPEYKLDLITVFFGWNDHGLYWQQDRYWEEPEKKKPSKIVRRIRNLRVCLLVDRILFLTRFSFAGRRLDEEMKDTRYAVSIDDYEMYIRRFIEVARRKKSHIIFLTSPNALIPGLEPSWLKKEKFVRSFETLTELHNRYNDQVRKVTSELRVPFIDIERMMKPLPKEEYYYNHLADPIHPNGKAHKLIADELFKLIVEKGWLEEKEAVSREGSD